MIAAVLLDAAVAHGPAALRPGGAAGDPVLVERLLREGRAQAVPVAPGLGDYVVDLVQRALEGLGHWWSPLRDLLGAHPGFIRGAALAIGLAAVVAILAVAFGIVVRARAPRLAAARDVTLAATTGAGRPAGGRDAAAWRAEMERRLAAADLRGAVEAAWWWVAASVAGGPPDPAWTTRELVGRAGRRDLVPAVRDLDRLAYGPAAIRPDEVRRLARTLEAVLA